LPLLFLACLVLFFGRPTLGALLAVVPGAKDLFLRRFLVGVQLAGLLLAGVGASQVGSLVVAGVRRVAKHLAIGPGRVVLPHLALGALALSALVPAWSFVITTADRNAALIAQQSSATHAVTDLDALVTVITSRGGGRTFAGDPSDWGAAFTVGDVPVFKFLASLDVDEVGFTLRTASLMSGPENQFDDSDPADYALFGVRWLLLPARMTPAVLAELVEVRGAYALWEIAANGYVQVVDTRGSIAANSGDLGSFSGVLLADLSANHPIYPTVAYEGGPPAPGTLADGVHPSSTPGTVLDEHADLGNGTVVAKVALKRPAVVLLSASYDPGWHALVDGRPATTEMVVPGLVGVRVESGVHTVRFVYQGFPDYPQLFGLGAVSLLLLVGIEWRKRRRARADVVGSGREAQAGEREIPPLHQGRIPGVG
jgi:hypothetical protein